MKMILYHGTSEKNGKLIEAVGKFVPDTQYNWDIKSKKGFVYLSLAYAPFYAMAAKSKGTMMTLVKCEVDTADLYPEDDFVMFGLGKSKYTQEELDKVDLEANKSLWSASLTYMGNAAAKPDKVRILGIRFFDGRLLVMKCDPVVSPLNFMLLGSYYKRLTEWLYEGKPALEFPMFEGQDVFDSAKKGLKEQNGASDV